MLLLARFPPGTGVVHVRRGAARLPCTRAVCQPDVRSGRANFGAAHVDASMGAPATLLPDGKVPVTGGNGGGFLVLAASELYDPTTNAWSPAASLTPGRERHTATLLSN